MQGDERQLVVVVQERLLTLNHGRQLLCLLFGHALAGVFSLQLLQLAVSGARR